MKIVIDDVLDNEFKSFLLSQDGINDVLINTKDFISYIDVSSNLSSSIIMKYIDLYLDNQFENILEFDKCKVKNFKSIKYLVDDMCCEYCYKGLVRILFDNDKIYKLSSNFSFDKPAYNIEFLIDYDDSLTEEDIIKLINDNK